MQDMKNKLCKEDIGIDYYGFLPFSTFRLYKIMFAIFKLISKSPQIRENNLPKYSHLAMAIAGIRP